MIIRFEWDENKRTTNLRKHGLDLPDAQWLFDGRPYRDFLSLHKDEFRFVRIGMVDDKCVVTVWIERESAIRLISFRMAREEEKRAYSKLHPVEEAKAENQEGLGIDKDVLEWFCSAGKMYQARINQILRTFMMAQKQDIANGINI